MSDEFDKWAAKIAGPTRDTIKEFEKALGRIITKPEYSRIDVEVRDIREETTIATGKIIDITSQGSKVEVLLDSGYKIELDRDELAKLVVLDDVTK